VTREVILTLMFLAVVGVIGVLALAWWSWPSSPLLDDKTTLVLDLSVPIVEGHDADTVPAFVRRIMGNGHEEVRLYDVLTGLTRAAKDPRISQLAVVATAPGQLGMAQARELSAAVKMFKTTSGKPVLAYGLSPDQKQYLVMAAADQVFLDPEGSVVLEGLSSFRPYFRSALVDKLGVDIHLFRVGEFKSAAEPFIRDSESDASRKASLFWMNDVWSRYLADLASLRKIPVSKLRKDSDDLAQSIAQSSGDLAQLALDDKLVDGVATDVDFHQRLAQAGKWDPATASVVRTDMSSYVDMVHAPSAASLAIVPIQGEIVDGEPGAGKASAPEVVSRLRQVLVDPNIKAVVVRIDSPGGSVLGSELIRREVERLVLSGRPVVVSMGNVAASGGYWIATASSTIVADPSTITGSIGIFGLYPNFSRALDKWGVHTDGSATSSMGGAMDPTRPLDPKVAAAVQQVIDHGYAQFLRRVSSARGMSLADADKIARGRVWTGHQAIDRQLVDRQGGLIGAVLAAARQAKLPATTGVVVMDGENGVASWLGSPQWSAHLRAAILEESNPLAQMGVRLPVWLQEAMTPTTGFKAKAYAHCLCSN
jgi:protease-4